MLGREEAPEVCESIAAFVRRQLENSERAGVAIGMSGGLDSTVTAALCVRGVGPGHVRGYFLPEKEGPSSDSADAELVADWLGIPLETHDLTGALGEIGVYDFVLSKVPGDVLRSAIVRGAYGLRRLLSGEDPLAGGQAGSKSAAVSRATAHFKVRHRMRMVTLFFRAERRNLLVAGAANLTERLTGIYTRFGVDDCAAIMPIAGLYRTEVLRLAESLGVPEAVRRKRPAPGIIPGVKDKYVYLLDLESETLDRVLEEIVRGVSAAEAAGKHDVPLEKVERVMSAVSSARHLLDMPLEPALGR
ncbi:MAG: NAD(+) synthase [Candidatus Eisenbacteria bacterium]|nr:NAD(+) synthase [Candidatus Eisenbacteria bacterium]